MFTLKNLARKGLTHVSNGDLWLSYIYAAVKLVIIGSGHGFPPTCCTEPMLNCFPKISSNSSLVWNKQKQKY